MDFNLSRATYLREGQKPEFKYRSVALEKKKFTQVYSVISPSTKCSQHSTRIIHDKNITCVGIAKPGLS